MKHLISTKDLSVDEIVGILDIADHMAKVNARQLPKVPALRGRTIASVFFEDSTRTRLSFETAAKRLSADVMTFMAAQSSLNKGESLRDTIETLSAMGIDALVIRHKSSGVPLQASQWTSASIINAGDGWHQHPTQALLDAYTITREFSSTHSLQGRAIAIVGDIKHSRVARSNIDVFTRLGATVIVVGPQALLPSDIDSWGVEVRHTIDDVITEVDVLYMLRMQKERMDRSVIAGLSHYNDLFSLTSARAQEMRHGSILMHPGPINRGVELMVDPSDVPGSRILQQVANGVAVRMAVLFTLLGNGSMASLGSGAEQ
ncbi:MAG: aspartate carbamoyltransferase [Actinomycetota bacterium]|jgi:aspartate carbamoyltransferase catalytic subunit